MDNFVLSKFPPPAGGGIFKNKFKIPAPAPPFYEIEEDVSKICIVQILEPLLYKYIVCLK